MLLLIDDETRLTSTSAGWRDRVAVRMQASRLDHDLSAGASPDADVRLALRAQQLVRTSVRRGLAKSVTRIMDSSATPVGPHRPSVPVCRDRVAACRDELETLHDRLCSPGPVSARGVAQVASFLRATDRDRSTTAPNGEDLRSRSGPGCQRLGPVRRGLTQAAGRGAVQTAGPGFDLRKETAGWPCCTGDPAQVGEARRCRLPPAKRPYPDSPARREAEGRSGARRRPVGRSRARSRCADAGPRRGPGARLR